MVKDRVIIIIGSSKDEEFSKPIHAMLNKMKIPYEMRISSAHKTPLKLLEMLENYELTGDRIVYITVAGKSNALSGIVDANTQYPVIACPALSDKFGDVDIYSSLRMPSGVAPLVILEPANAALAAAKILALSNSEIREKMLSIKKSIQRQIELDNKKLRNQG